MIKSKEIWKDIVGYEGFYQISDWGRVKALSRERYNGHKYHLVDEFIRKPQIKSGYHVLKLSKNKKSVNFRVHRIVAEHFIPNPNNHPVINHIDEDKTNNQKSNLEWCTQKENLAHGNARKKQSTAQNIPIYKCDLDGNIIKRYDSMLSVRDDGFDNGCVGACCSGKRKTHKGYIWRYVDD